MILKDLAPEIVRQRHIIEGYYSVDLDEEKVKKFLLKLAESLNLRTYAEPMVYAPRSGMGKDENAGFDAFVPLIDSGISAYFWSAQQFFSVMIYTCKEFDSSLALSCIKEFLQVDDRLVEQAI